jgi:hypothetical protein
MQIYLLKTDNGKEETEIKLIDDMENKRKDNRRIQRQS